MDVLLRVLGIQLLARVAARLPGAVAWWATLVVLVLVNLLPILAVQAGHAGIGDVFLLYWWENVVVWLTGIVRIATAQGGDTYDAVFFSVHYGAFTLAHGAFTAFIVYRTGGLHGGLVTFVLLAAAITLSHLLNLGLIWFGRGERHVVSPTRAMFLPYPRMLVLQVAVIIGFIIALDDASDQRTAVVVLCVLKLLVDLAFHVHARRRLPVDDGQLYGAAAAVE